MEWISVEDRPLVIETENNYEKTDDAMGDFLAATPLKNNKWFIRCSEYMHEKETWYSILDVTHWMPLPEPPNK